MFTMEDDYIMAAFLHPNYKQLRGVTSSQITDCHSTCRLFLLPDPSPSVILEEVEDYEPPMKGSMNKAVQTLAVDFGQLPKVVFLSSFCPQPNWHFGNGR
jgi:hypothetical protein